MNTQHIKNMIKNNNGPTEAFILRVIATFLISMGIIISIIFYASYKPLKIELEESLLENFQEVSNTQYLSLKNSINTNLKEATSLAKKIDTHQAVLDYQENRLTLKELTEIVQPMYEKNVESLEYLMTAERYVGSNRAASWGASIALPFEEHNKSDEPWYGIKLVDNQDYLIVHSPIRSYDERIIGCDQLIFNFKEEIASIATEGIASSLVNQEDIDKLKKHAKWSDKTSLSDAFYHEGNYYQSYYLKDNLAFVTKQDKETLFKPVNNLTKYVLFVGAIIFFVYTIVVYFLLVRYVNKELSENHALLKNARIEADIDIMTHAYSRRFGENQLKKVFKQFKKTKSSPAIILFDIDTLKEINDTYGHTIGDKVIQAVALTVQENIRSEDLLIRWGGDEFIGFFNGLRNKDALAFSSKLLQKVSDIEIKTENGIVQPTISIGISYFTETDETYMEVVNRADLAMYQSKNKGKNRTTTL